MFKLWNNCIWYNMCLAYCIRIYTAHLYLYLYGKKCTVTTTGWGRRIHMPQRITCVNVSRACSAASSPPLLTKASSCILSSLNLSSLFSDRQAARPYRATHTHARSALCSPSTSATFWQKCEEKTVRSHCCQYFSIFTLCISFLLYLRLIICIYSFVMSYLIGLSLIESTLWYFQSYFCSTRKMDGCSIIPFQRNAQLLDSSGLQILGHTASIII